MYVHANKKQLTEWVEHSNYLVVLGALLIGFVFARNIIKPDFVSKATPTSESMIARSVPTDSTHGSAISVEEVETVPSTYFAATNEINAAQPVPQVFVKVQSAESEYLLHVGTSNFVSSTNNFKNIVMPGEGHFLLRINGENVIEFFSSPLYLSPTRLADGNNIVQIILVDNM
ncbi:MAG: hypothetical protein Q8O99_08205 [bacterium]|nr:hypothetical protein [bacterium]